MQKGGKGGRTFHHVPFLSFSPSFSLYLPTINHPSALSLSLSSRRRGPTSTCFVRSYHTRWYRKNNIVQHSLYLLARSPWAGRFSLCRRRACNIGRPPAPTSANGRCGGGRGRGGENPLRPRLRSTLNKIIPVFSAFQIANV